MEENLDNSEEDSGIYLNDKNKMGKNMKMQQKKLKISEIEKQSGPKKAYKVNRKKDRLRKSRKMRMKKLILKACPSPS